MERPMWWVQLGDMPYTIAMLAVLTVAATAVDVDKDGSGVAVDVDESVTDRKFTLGWGVW